MLLPVQLNISTSVLQCFNQLEEKNEARYLVWEQILLITVTVVGEKNKTASALHVI